MTPKPVDHSAHDNYSVWPLGNAQYDEPRDWPQISIVTPNYNGAGLLPATIESVLSQGYPNLQYAVLDADSSDGSQQVIERYADRLHYWHSRPDRGQYDAINEGFAQTSGEICAWLNSDDQYCPWTLHTVGALFRDFPEIQWLTGIPSIMLGGRLYHVPFLKNGYCRELIEAGCYGSGPLPTIQQESSFWRRSLWEKAGGLDLSYPLAADFQLWTKFAQHADLVTTYFVLGSFNQTGENRSVRQRNQYEQDIAHCLQALDPDVRKRRTRVRRYQRVSHLPVVRKIYRWLSGLSKLRCRILHCRLTTGELELRDIPPGL